MAVPEGEKGGVHRLGAEPSFMPHVRTRCKGLPVPLLTHTFGRERNRVPALSVYSEGDRLLGAVAPLALGAAADTALVVDLDPEGPHYPGQGSLASLKEAGLAVLRNGGVRSHTVADIVDALIDGWPAVVLRMAEPSPWSERAPMVSVHALLPGMLIPPEGDRVVYQRTSFAVPAPRGGVVVPMPSLDAVARLLGGVAPTHSRWIRAWREVWRWA